ncbi:MAG: glycosyltransferase [Pseudomonadota bacterium]|nr:glycosyltransferase [Pseudomonadota bacterium]
MSRRVLHLESGRHLYGGARQVAYLIEGLARAGLDNVLVCPPAGALARADLPARLAPLPLHGDVDPLLPFRLAWLLRRERADLLHVHSRRGADLYGGLAARLAGVPAVLSRRVDHPEGRLGRALKYPQYRRIVAISAAIGRVLTAQGVPPARVRVVPSAVPVPAVVDRAAARRALAARYGLSPEAPVVAMAAQFIPRKGHAVLLAALPQVLAAQPQARFLLFGQGPLQAQVAEQVARRFDGRVILPGFEPSLATLLPGLDLLVHPALAEGLGVILLQAGAVGVPAVACAAGGMPEVVRDGQTGLLVPPGDADALAAALIRLLREAPLRRRLGEAARQHVQAHFSTEAMVAGNLAVYESLWQGTGA